jgi:hypothetical protein
MPPEQSRFRGRHGRRRGYAPREARATRPRHGPGYPPAQPGRAVSTGIGRSAASAVSV